MSTFAAVLAILACVTPLPAAPLRIAPHDPGLSSVRVSRTPAGVHVHAAFANADFTAATQGDLRIDDDGNGAIDASELTAALPRLGTLVREQFLLRHEQHCSGGELLTATLADNQDVELVMSFAPSPVSSPQLQLLLLRRLSLGHRCYVAALGTRGTIVADALLRPVGCTFPLPAAEGPATTGFSQPWAFCLLGVEHILLGFDHLAFLLALLAAGVAWRTVVATITAFTLAHSLTLLAAATGLVSLPGTLVEAAIAGSIVVVALANLWQRGRTVHRWPLAFAFGLVHGFGFAGVLEELQIGGPDMLLPLLTFNLGVEAGQLVFALVAVPLLVLASRHPRGRHLPTLVSVVVGLAGLRWLWERLCA